MEKPMNRVLMIALLGVLLACQPPWMIPNGRIETLADHKDDVYNFLKNYHDTKFKSDKMTLVQQTKIITKQTNGLGSTESWYIRTEGGNLYEYTIQIAFYIDIGRAQVAYLIQKVRFDSKLTL